ncbi:MAG: glycosyltransferase [Pseudomonadota bacterium]|nr:glycosyltransferase [Pseudomonadota bacterium]
MLSRPMPQVFSLPFKDRAAHPLAGVTVLQLVPNLEVNPTARAAIEIAAALGAADARALVACAGGRMMGELQAKGGVFVPFPSRTKNPLAMALNVRRLARLIAAESADIVHVRSRALAWVAFGATRLTKTPFVTTFPSVYQGSNPIARRYNSALARGDAVLADSNFTAALIAKLHSPAAGKIRVVRHGLDCQVFTPDAVAPARVQAARRHWKVVPHERIVLLAAQTSPGSGHKILIEAAGLLSRSGLAGVKFILASDRDENSALDRGIDRAIATEGLQGNMYRTGHCDMPAALLAASIVVVPATEARAFGDAAVQAQAMGTPVIAANLGAAPETVLAPPMVEESSRTGFLVPPGNAAALALAIARVLSLGAAACCKLSLRAKKHVETCFSAEHMCAETLKAYVDVRRGGER